MPLLNTPTEPQATPNIIPKGITQADTIARSTIIAGLMQKTQQPQAVIGTATMLHGKHGDWVNALKSLAG